MSLPLPLPLHHDLENSGNLSFAPPVDCKTPYSPKLRFHQYTYANSVCEISDLCVWQVHMHWIVRLGLWFALEFIWNVFPSSPTSSLSLQACHLCILVGLWTQPRLCRPYV